MQIIQRMDLYKFGVEAVLLANFADKGVGGKAVDLGSGDGIIPLLLAYKKGFNVLGLEIQEELVEISSKSVALNQLEDQIEIKQMDICKVPQEMLSGGYDLVTANPPFFPINSGKQNPNRVLAMARHEIKGSLRDFIKAAAHLLCQGGWFYLVHRPERLVDILSICREYKLEPKKLCLVQPRKALGANIMLLACSKGAKTGLSVLPTLELYQGAEFSSEIKAIYEGGAFG